MASAPGSPDGGAFGGDGGNGAAPQVCEALVLTNLANGRWLTGFSGSAMIVVLTPDDLLVITDSRYATQAPAELEAAGVEGRVVIANRGADQQEAATGAIAGLRRVALEADHVSWSRYRTFAGEWFGDADLVPATGVIERLRRRKSPEEVARVAAAAAAADGALAEMLPRLAERPTEGEVAAELDYLMRRRGASGSAFDTIVAAGDNSALPHARPGPRRIERGDLVVIDFGAIVDGYRSDMTRTVCVGEPRAPGGRIYEVVRESQQAGVETVAAGVSCADVDTACRDVISDAGWGEAFPAQHGPWRRLGHPRGPQPQQPLRRGARRRRGRDGRAGHLPGRRGRRADRGHRRGDRRRLRPPHVLAQDAGRGLNADRR